MEKQDSLEITLRNLAGQKRIRWKTIYNFIKCLAATGALRL
jgi:hypothetical protein